jgi:hypothetical protein
MGTRIGGTGSITSPFSGGVDDIRIYAKNLTSSEMCQRATGELECAPYNPPDDGGGQNSGPGS